MLPKNIKKKFTPSFFRKRQRKLRDLKIAEEFSALSTKATFEKIYDEQMWGRPLDTNRRYSSGDGTRDELISAAYIDAITCFLSEKNNLQSALDLGCGDFTIGAKFCDFFTDYRAADVASNVIDENKKFYNSKNVKFSTIDLTEDYIPEVDVIFVRQVLQHLSNDQVSKFVRKISGKFQHLIVTESLSKSIFFKPNKDIITGPGIRIHERSGIVLEDSPFKLKHSKLEVILKISKGKEVFMTKVYTA